MAGAASLAPAQHPWTRVALSLAWPGAASCVLHANHEVLSGDLTGPHSTVLLWFPAGNGLGVGTRPLEGRAGRSWVRSLRCAAGQAGDSNVGPWREDAWLLARGRCSWGHSVTASEVA